MYDDVATLRSISYELDDALNQVETYEDREVFVKPRSVYANDFYNAAMSGLKPSLVLVLSHAEDYEDEKVVLFHGKEYTVLRTYMRPESDALEITLEERKNNGQ